MTTADATRAVIVAARELTAHFERMARNDVPRHRTVDIAWRDYATTAELALIDALAQYDREAKDE